MKKIILILITISVFFILSLSVYAQTKSSIVQNASNYIEFKQSDGDKYLCIGNPPTSWMNAYYYNNELYVSCGILKGQENQNYSTYKYISNDNYTYSGSITNCASWGTGCTIADGKNITVMNGTSQIWPKKTILSAIISKIGVVANKVLGFFDKLDFTIELSADELKVGGLQVKNAKIYVNKDGNYTTGTTDGITPAGTPNWNNTYVYDMEIINNSFNNVNNNSCTVNIKDQNNNTIVTNNYNIDYIKNNNNKFVISIPGEKIPQKEGQYQINVKEEVNQNEYNDVAKFYYILSATRSITITNLTEGQQLNYIPYINIKNEKEESSYLFVNNTQITTFSAIGQYVINPDNSGLIFGRNLIQIKANTTTTNAIVAMNIDILRDKNENIIDPGPDQGPDNITLISPHNAPNIPVVLSGP
jgi:hypothetical protein